MRKVVALTAIAGIALASDFDGAVDNNLAAGLIEFPRIQRHPLFLDSALPVNEVTEMIGQRELILKNFPIMIKQADDADDELFADFADMEFRDRKPTFSIFDKKKVEKSEKCEHADKGEDHELSVFLDYVKSQPKHVQKAIFEAHPIFTKTPISKTQSETKGEVEVKNVQKRSNYTVFGKREAAVKPTEESINQGRTAFTNFGSKKEANVQKVQEELTALYAKWLVKQGLLQNDDELYGIKNIMKKDKDSWKGGVLSLDDEEDNELATISLIKRNIHDAIINANKNYPKTPKDILGDAANAVREVKEKNTKPALRPIFSSGTR